MVSQKLQLPAQFLATAVSSYCAIAFCMQKLPAVSGGGYNTLVFPPCSCITSLLHTTSEQWPAIHSIEHTMMWETPINPAPLIPLPLLPPFLPEIAETQGSNCLHLFHQDALICKWCVQCYYIIGYRYVARLSPDNYLYGKETSIELP